MIVVLSTPAAGVEAKFNDLQLFCMCFLTAIKVKLGGLQTGSFMCNIRAANKYGIPCCFLDNPYVKDAYVPMSNMRFLCFSVGFSNIRGLRWAALGCYGLLGAAMAYQNCLNFLEKFNDCGVVNACRGSAWKQNSLICMCFISVF